MDCTVKIIHGLYEIDKDLLWNKVLEINQNLYQNKNNLLIIRCWESRGYWILFYFLLLWILLVQIWEWVDGEKSTFQLTGHLFSSGVWQSGRLLVDGGDEGGLDPESDEVLDVEALRVDDGVQERHDADQDSVEVAFPLRVVALLVKNDYFVLNFFFKTFLILKAHSKI